MRRQLAILATAFLVGLAEQLRGMPQMTRFCPTTWRALGAPFPQDSILGYLWLIHRYNFLKYGINPWRYTP